jgi:hypothetical protein
MNDLAIRLMIFWNSYSYFWLITRHVELVIVFDSADGHPKQTKEPATVLTISVIKHPEVISIRAFTGIVV